MAPGSTGAIAITAFDSVTYKTAISFGPLLRTLSTNKNRLGSGCNFLLQGPEIQRGEMFFDQIILSNIKSDQIMQSLRSCKIRQSSNLLLHVFLICSFQVFLVCSFQVFLVCSFQVFLVCSFQVFLVCSLKVFLVYSFQVFLVYSFYIC